MTANECIGKERERHQTVYAHDVHDYVCFTLTKYKLFTHLHIHTNEDILN